MHVAYAKQLTSAEMSKQVFDKSQSLTFLLPELTSIIRDIGLLVNLVEFEQESELHLFRSVVDLSYTVLNNQL